VPCFFNPQHGPSTTDQIWNQPKVGTRTVLACAQCTARVKAGEEPDVRYVDYGARRVPYWEAGGVCVPYGAGYFASGGGSTSSGAFEVGGGHSAFELGHHGGHGGGHDGGAGSDGGGGY
jgi:hypothetical protein